MTTVTIHEAKTQLSRLIAQAEAGEEIIISRHHTPVVKLVALEPQPHPKRQFGCLKGVIDLDERFFEPLPDDELALWNGE